MSLLCRLFGHKPRCVGGLLSPQVWFCLRCHHVLGVEVMK